MAIGFRILGQTPALLLFLLLAAASVRPALPQPAPNAPLPSNGSPDASSNPPSSKQPSSNLPPAVVLPPGETLLTEPLRFAHANGLRLEGHPSGSTLRLAPSFAGPAAIVVEAGQNISLRNFTIVGNREQHPLPLPLPKHDETFANHYPANGILVRAAGPVTISSVTLRHLASFAILVSNCRQVRIHSVTVEDSGSRYANGRNNTTGGILLEDGTQDFAVTNSHFRRILGNALWTHARYQTPRNSLGDLSGNHFSEIGRDAIQVGHATRVTVARNQIHRVGYPIDAVDIENQGIPVGVDTAGNVDASHYTGNHITEVNGKCFDLDGFHHGTVTGNHCRNAGPLSLYPTGHFGIVMNNTNPDMQSVGIRIAGNRISGMKFGGLFLIGSGHLVEDNRFEDLGQAGCGDPKLLAGCLYLLAEPNMLRHGIYLGQRAEREAFTRGNRLQGNLVSGPQMPANCIGFAPKVRPSEQTLRNNHCVTLPPRSANPPANLRK